MVGSKDAKVKWHLDYGGGYFVEKASPKVAEYWQRIEARMADDDEKNPLFSGARGRYYDPDGSVAKMLDEAQPMLDDLGEFWKAWLKVMRHGGR